MKKDERVRELYVHDKGGTVGDAFDMRLPGDDGGVGIESYLHVGVAKAGVANPILEEVVKVILFCGDDSL